MKNAFTMIEMIFVIVVLGILAAIAVPKFAATRTDAEITKGRADISAIRSAIVTERQGRLIRGDSTWIATLSDASTPTILFSGADANQTLLMYGIAAGAGSGHWSGTDPNYTFTIQTTEVPFTYYPINSGTNKAGTFTCVTGDDAIGTMCKKLIN